MVKLKNKKLLTTKQSILDICLKLGQLYLIIILFLTTDYLTYLRLNYSVPHF